MIETGLIVSVLSPRIGYLPDGVVFNKGVPAALLEIKCPFARKTKNINETVLSIVSKSFYINDNQVKLKKKHQYYRQIQLRMTVINIKCSFFVIYSSSDKQMLILIVDRNDCFVEKMLTRLKHVYYEQMLSNMCEYSDDNTENHKPNDN